MASYRPFHPQPSFPPQDQTPLPPPRPTPFPPPRSFLPSSSSSGSQLPSGSSSYGSNYAQHHRPFHSSSHPFQNPNPQQYPFPPPPPPPIPAAPPPPPPQAPPYPIPPPLPPLNPLPPPSLHYNSSQYFNSNSPPPPPPPPPPPSSPPPSLPPPPPPPTDPRAPPKELNAITRRDPNHSKLVVPSKSHKDVSAVPGRIETEEERRLRKKREFEKQQQEEKRRRQLKESQANILHKTQMLSSGNKLRGAMVESRVAERKSNPLLGAERFDNRLKKPTTFLCKLKFRNELPDPTAQPRLLSLSSNNDQYTKYTITSLEKLHKPKLFVEPDLGIPLDLLDISVYNPPKTRSLLAPEDEELLRDSELTTPVKQEGIRIKERPTDKGVSWLVKTQYISPLSMDSAKMSITEKQAKELRETREGRKLVLEDLNNRGKQIQAIEESFKAAKLRPVHQSNPKLEPVEILPLLPNFDRFDDQFVMVSFDGDPIADSEMYKKLSSSICDDLESRAIMKSFAVTGTDPNNPEKFLAYMTPVPEELSKDMFDEQEDIAYSWVREYTWHVKGDADGPTTYLVNFDEDAAHYFPLPTKLSLRKRRAKEGRPGDDVEQYPVPSRIIVRNRPVVAARELKDSGEMTSNHGYAGSKTHNLNLKRSRSTHGDELKRKQIARQVFDEDQFSEAEDVSE